jgi:lipoprotein signal peptidase
MGVRVATVILIVTFAFAGAYALLTIALPELIEGITFQAVTGGRLTELQDMGVRRAFRIVSRHEGLFALTTVIPSFFILFTGFRKSERWAWWAIFSTGILAWGWGIADSLTHGGYVNFWLHILGVVIMLVGLLLPMKEFFRKDTSS